MHTFKVGLFRSVKDNGPMSAKKHILKNITHSSSVCSSASGLYESVAVIHTPRQQVATLPCLIIIPCLSHLMQPFQTLRTTRSNETMCHVPISEKYMSIG